MNRNSEGHFQQIPKIHISRSTFNRNQDIKTTFNAGKLIPFYVDEVLPGDTFSVDTAGIVRMTTPIFPVMDNAYLDVYYFYTPCRILWNHWKEFMGESPSQPWKNTADYTVPGINITMDGTKPQEGSILDYMGVPTKMAGRLGKGMRVNALPVRAYVKIWNEFFRDENLDVGAAFSDTDGTVAYVNYEENESITTTLKNAIKGSSLLPVNKYHDYFTSCLPSPQRGDPVYLPASGTLAPVKLMERNNYNMTVASDLYEHQVLIGKGTYGSTTYDDGGGVVNDYMNGGGAEVYGYKVDNANDYAKTFSAGYLWTDLSSTQSATVNQLREALAVQHYYEALARGGTRYREIIRNIFGAEISDKTVQVPEYLGGGRYPINISQVIQTSSTNETSPQGNTGAMSVTPFRESSFTKSFEEHGFVIGVCCVRHDRTYQQGLERFWDRKDRLDYYVPQLANIGEQPVYKWELYCGNGTGQYYPGMTDGTPVFGYQEAWADYRMKPNRVSGKMRSNAEGTLDSWHYADYYSTAPTLSSEWMKEGDTEIQRTLAVENEPQFFGDFYVMNKTTRPMPLYSVPGLNKL